MHSFFLSFFYNFPARSSSTFLKHLSLSTFLWTPPSKYLLEAPQSLSKSLHLTRMSSNACSPIDLLVMTLVHKSKSMSAIFDTIFHSPLSIGAIMIWHIKSQLTPVHSYPCNRPIGWREINIRSAAVVYPRTQDSIYNQRKWQTSLGVLVTLFEIVYSNRIM